jgi:hypothetical protein
LLKLGFSVNPEFTNGFRIQLFSQQTAEGIENLFFLPSRHLFLLWESND